jgi:PAS domain S-box-containing protein
MKLASLYNSLNFKFYVALTAMLLLTIAGSIYMYRSSAHYLQKLISVEFENATRSVNNSFSLIEKNTLSILKNIAADRELSQVLLEPERNKIQSRITKLRESNNIDIVFLLDRKGGTVAYSGNQTLSSNAIQKLRTIHDVQNPLQTKFQFISLDKQLFYYQTSLLNHTFQDNSYLILAGVTIDAALLRSIKSNPHIDISLLFNNQIQSTTNDTFQGTTVLPPSSDKITKDDNCDEYTINSHPYFTQFVAFSPGSDTTNAIFLFTHSIKDLSRLNRNILLKLTTFLCLQILFLFLFGLFFARNFHYPIQNFTDTISKISKGKFDSRITFTSSTELETLAEHFNNMTDFIREKDQNLEMLVKERTNRLERKKTFIDNILNSTSDLGIVATDISRKITYANPTAEKLFSYKAENIIGQPIELIHRSAETPLDTVIHGIDTISTNKRFFFTVEQLRNGSPMQIECTVTEMIAKDNALTGYLLLARDMTKPRAMDQRLRKTMAELDVIFENSSLAIVYEYEETITRVNKAFETMFQFDRQEVLGQQWQIFFSTLHKGKTDSFWDKLTKAHYVQNKNGEEFWITINKRSSEPDNPAAGVIWIFEDISKQKEAELKIKQLSLAVEQSSNSVIITDTYGTIQYVNSAFSNTTGYTFDEAIGKTPSILQSGKTPDAVYKQMWKTISSGKEWSGQFVNKKKSGELYEEHVTVAPIRNEDGKITNYIATKENITELKHARRQADLANQAKSEFLANMSHEIRTPMNLIFGMTELLLDTELQPEQHKFLDRIQSAATNLLNLINDILDYSKIESGKLIFEQKPMVLERLFADLEGAFALTAEQKGLDFRVILDNEPGFYPIGDQLRLYQILMNLTGNAFKFTGHGKIEVKSILQDLDEKHCTALFTVKDTGIGINPETQKDIFDSFSQANSSITREYGGTGLGLAISSKLITLMGGTIKLSSSPGLGSIFSFTLVFPKGDGREVVQEIDDVPHTHVAPLNILVVEDNVANQELAELVLQKDNHHVTICDNGLDALKALCKNSFDVILMDVQMPVMDGLTATSTIRNFEKNTKDPLPEHPVLQKQLSTILSNKHIAIIAMTANAMSGDKEKCLEAGTDDYLTKPYNTEKIRAALARVKGGPDAKDDAPTENSSRESDTNIPLRASREDALAHLLANFSIKSSSALTILDTFIQSIATSLTGLSQALKEKDMKAIAMHAHKAKGSLLNLGIQRQALTCEKIENHALASNIQECQAVIAELQQELRELLSPPS